MLRRAGGLVGGSCSQVAGGTFHSFAHQVLRRYARDLDLAPSFTILDRGDSEDVIGLVRGELALDRKERRFPRKQTLGEIFSMAVNRGKTVATLVETAYTHLAMDLEGLLRVDAR